MSIFLLSEGLIRLQSILKLSFKGRVAITTRKINFLNPDSVKNVLKDLKMKEHQRIIVDCHYDRVHDILKEVGGDKSQTNSFLPKQDYFRPV